LTNIGYNIICVKRPDFAMEVWGKTTKAMNWSHDMGEKSIVIIYHTIEVMTQRHKNATTIIDSNNLNVSSPTIALF